MPSVGDLFGEGTTANQLLVWGVLNQVLSALLQPFTLALSNVENAAFPNVPLSPADAAQLVARNRPAAGQASDEAAKSGVDTDVLGWMADLARRDPDVSTVLELVRRGLATYAGEGDGATSLQAALEDAGIRPQWHAAIAQLVHQLPSTAEVINAWLEGQISPDEAKRRWAEAGGDPTWLQAAYNSGGQAPTPVQALELWNRGIIPEGGTGPGAVSYEQAFLEGPWRNKWLPAFKALREYLPPPRTVTAMYNEGRIDRAMAAKWLAQQGLQPDTIAIYLKPKDKATTATERHLSKTDLLTLYKDKGISKADTVAGLVKLGYSTHDADELVSLADLQAQIAANRVAQARIKALFDGGKLARADALSALVSLGLPRTEATQLLDTWELHQSARVRELTPAQIEAATYYEFLTVPEGLARLVAMGYTEHDAWLAMSVRLKAKAGVEPPRDR